MQEILNIIENYNQILIYRHVNPDLDAFGSSYGMFITLQELYPEKSFIMMGERSSDLLAYLPELHEQPFQDIPSLGIVLDTANKDRIDGDITLCEKIIKIDHHIIIDNYGNVNVVDEEASSCAQIVTLMFKDVHISLNKNAASCLYLGMVTDSNRFLYSSTSKDTFLAASYLLESDIDITKLYNQLYLKNKWDLKVKKFIYSHFQEDGGVAYYYMSQKDLDNLDITREQASQYVNTLSNIIEYPIWFSVTENIKDNNYRVSIRSRDIAINKVAASFRGGGHSNAAGATLESLDEINDLIYMLKEVIKNG